MCTRAFPMATPLFTCFVSRPFPTVQFLITYSVQKWKRKTWEHLSHKWCQWVPKWKSALLTNVLPWSCTTLLCKCSVHRIITARKGMNITLLFGPPPLSTLGTCWHCKANALRPFPFLFAHCKWKKLDGRMAWKQGYFCSLLKILPVRTSKFLHDNIIYI